jgi:HAD superfamily hydrolase (TIGR01458 family)
MGSAGQPLVSAVLLDIQGTLIAPDGTALRGASSAVDELRAMGLSVRFVTNIDSVPVSVILQRLHAAGISAEMDEIFSPVSVALRKLRASEHNRCHLLLPPGIEEEFAPFRAENGDVDWVVVGDCREGFTYERLNAAFTRLRNGAEILALQKSRWFQAPDGPRLDTGAFVSALEYGANTVAHVVGKPSAELLHIALSDLDDPYEAVMVGDDVATDVPGAHAAGARSVLVRTGKFSLSALERSERHPDVVLDSIEELPAWIRSVRR